MRSRERVMGALEGDWVDRVPALYQYLTGGPELLAEMGLTVKECYHDPERFARGCAAIPRRFGYDNTMAGWGSILLEAHSMGTEIEFLKENAYPRSVRPAIKGPDDLEALEPIDPWEDELLSVRLRGSEILLERHGMELAVMGSVLTPLPIALELRGYESALMDMYSDEGLAHGYLAVITESVQAYGQALADIGMDLIFTENDATAREGYLPLDKNIEFDLDYARQVVDHFSKVGLRTIVGNIAHEPLVLEQLQRLRPNAIQFNPAHIDTTILYRETKGKVCIILGIDETMVYEGPPDRIARAVEETFASYGSWEGIMMGAAYEVPFNTPWENIHALNGAIRELRPSSS